MKCSDMEREWIPKALRWWRQEHMWNKWMSQDLKKLFFLKIMWVISSHNFFEGFKKAKQRPFCCWIWSFVSDEMWFSSVCTAWFNFSCQFPLIICFVIQFLAAFEGCRNLRNLESKVLFFGCKCADSHTEIEKIRTETHTLLMLFIYHISASGNNMNHK